MGRLVSARPSVLICKPWLRFPGLPGQIGHAPGNHTLGARAGLTVHNRSQRILLFFFRVPPFSGSWLSIPAIRNTFPPFLPPPLSPRSGFSIPAIQNKRQHLWTFLQSLAGGLSTPCFRNIHATHSLNARPTFGRPPSSVASPCATSTCLNVGNR